MQGVIPPLFSAGGGGSGFPSPRFVRPGMAGWNRIGIASTVPRRIGGSGAVAEHASNIPDQRYAVKDFGPTIGSSTARLALSGNHEPEPYSAAISRSARPRSTLTSVETPRSAMVTPNSRFIRLMVMGLWVITTKRVSVVRAISSSRSQ
jgi:hypothetical protein